MLGLKRFEGKTLGRRWGCVFILGLLTACSGLPEKDRLPAGESGCLGSIFLRQGQLVKLHLKNVVTLEHPYVRFTVREALISPDLQKVGLLVQTGSEPEFTSRVLFFECDTQRWHQAYQSQPDTQFSNLQWHPDGSQVAFFEQRVQNYRQQGKDWHRFHETLTSLSWPSFEVRNVVHVESSPQSGKGLLADLVQQKISQLIRAQFHPTQSLMLLETRPKNHPHTHVFRLVDLSQARPEYPTDFKRWFEVPATQHTQVFLMEAQGLRIERLGGTWVYTTAPLGKNEFKSLEVNPFLTGEGVQPLYFRERNLYFQVKTTTRTHVMALTFSPEAVPHPTPDASTPQRLIASSSVLETLLVFEGHGVSVSDFDWYLNRVIYSCRPQTTQRNQICVATISDKPIQSAAAFVADADDSIYPVLTYWPR